MSYLSDEIQGNKETKADESGGQIFNVSNGPHHHEQNTDGRNTKSKYNSFVHSNDDKLKRACATVHEWSQRVSRQVHIWHIISS